LTTIAHITDLHFGREDPAVVDALSSDLIALRPDVLIVGGDLTRRARHEQFKNARAFLDSIDCPKLIIPGNHDVPLWNFGLRLARPFWRFSRYFPTGRVQFFENQDVCVATVNSARRFSARVNGFWKDGVLRRADLATACSRFATSKSRVKILATHHPFVMPDARFGGNAALNARRAVAPLINCGVSLVLGGHLHHAYAVMIDGRLLSVQASTACSTRTRVQPCGYTAIRVGEVTEIRKRTWSENSFVESHLEVIATESC